MSISFRLDSFDPASAVRSVQEATGRVIESLPGRWLCGQEREPEAGENGTHQRLVERMELREPPVGPTLLATPADEHTVYGVGLAVAI